MPGFVKAREQNFFQSMREENVMGSILKGTSFSSLYYKVLNDNSDQNGKDSKKCKDDGSAHLVAL